MIVQPPTCYLLSSSNNSELTHPHLLVARSEADARRLSDSPTVGSGGLEVASWTIVGLGVETANACAD